MKVGALCASPVSCNESLRLRQRDACADGSNDNLAARTASLIANFMAKHPDSQGVVLPAMSVAIGADGTLLYADGFGNAGPNRPATARTIYMVGSITKQFTAAAMFRLIEKGAVPLYSREPLIDDDTRL